MMSLGNKELKWQAMIIKIAGDSTLEKLYGGTLKLHPHQEF